ncbi:hypothetical protein AXF42_Ash011505 [Apostasia shenzhenica]|uniref:Uncharacterized protein n=1 Tax=Apostasia shenzhenica TaxID=1088818 RepID=A0A2I0BAS9_9ASPA|nr:hypothetical protein AXF42_Ash011505 [Apostasia shenzhenica]
MRGAEDALLHCSIASYFSTRPLRVVQSLVDRLAHISVSGRRSKGLMFILENQVNHKPSTWQQLYYSDQHQAKPIGQWRTNQGKFCPNIGLVGRVIQAKDHCSVHLHPYTGAAAYSSRTVCDTRRITGQGKRS